MIKKLINQMVVTEGLAGGICGLLGFDRSPDAVQEAVAPVVEQVSRMQE